MGTTVGEVHHFGDSSVILRVVQMYMHTLINCSEVPFAGNFSVICKEFFASRRGLKACVDWKSCPGALIS